MYLANAIGTVCSAFGKKLLNVCRRREPESTPLVEGQEREAGAYEAMTGPDVVDSRRKSLSSGFETFDQSGSALKLCGVLVAGYLVIGIVAFSFVFEKWPVISSAYFSVVVFTTVGYGDLSPTTQGGRLFTVFFTLYGVSILGVFLGILGSHIIQAEALALEKVKTDSQTRVLHMFSNGKADADNTLPQPNEVETEVKSKKKSLWEEIVEIVLLEAPIVALILAVAIAVGWSEGWSIIDSIYFCTITVCTVGFGDMHPDKPSMRLLLIFFLPCAVAVFGELLGRIASAYIDRKARKFETDFLTRVCTVSDLEAMDRDFDSKVTRGEFISFMLVAMQKVEQESLDELHSLFDSLDADGSGVLEKDDLVLLAKRRKEKLAQTNASAAGLIV